MPHLTDTPAAPPSLFGSPGRLSPAAARARCVSLLQLYRANAKAQTVIWRTFGGDVTEVRARTAPLITSFTTTALRVVQTRSQARRLTLGTILGGVACPFMLMALLRAGAEGAVVQATFRSAMLEELGRATDAITVSARNVFIECIRTLRNYFPDDTVVAHAIMMRPSLRHREECCYLSAPCAASSLAAWYGVPDFRRAAQAVHDAGCGPFMMLISNAALSASDLRDCLGVLVASGRAAGWFTPQMHRRQTAPELRVVQRPAPLDALSGHWRALYENWHGPVGRLWVATSAHPTRWLPVFAEIVQSARSISGTLPDVAKVVTAWPPSARHMAGALFAASSNPDTASFGHSLQADMH